jgi:hypothetical protein
MSSPPSSQFAKLMACNPLDDGPPMPQQLLQRSNWQFISVGHTKYRVACRVYMSSGLSILPVAAGLQDTAGNEVVPTTCCPGPSTPNLPLPCQSSAPGNGSGLPVIAVPGQIIRTQSPSMSMVVSWEALREDGFLPVCPHPQATCNQPFLNGWIDYAGPALDEAGSEERGYLISGTYIYGMAQPRKLSDGLYLPMPVTDAGQFGGTAQNGQPFIIQKVNFQPGVFGFSLNPPAPATPGSGVPDPNGAVLQGMPLGTEGLFD